MMLEDEEFREVRTTRRAHRSRRIDVMREWDSGIVDERPTKERFSREFKKAKIKRIKDPVENIGEENCVEGLVVEVHRRTCEVRLSEETVTAMYRATTSKALGEFPAVGDRVLVGLVNDGDDSGDGVGSQKYCIVRVVASVTQPEFNYGFMDRFLLAANLNSLPFVLVLTKMDLLEGELPESIRDFASIVDKFIPISVKNGEGLETLKAELQGKSSVFSGQSGVGKSTLVNALVPDAGLETGAVREKDGKGRHTTISSSLFDLPGGGYVIDTPGIRSIGLMDMDAESLAKIFPGFFESDLFTCKFSNCLHVKEVGCSVLEKLRDGRLSKARYESYRRILGSKD